MTILIHNEPASSTDPYLYLWTNNENGKRYLGIHNGRLGLRYGGSGSAFVEAYKENPQHFTRTILEYNTDYSYIQQKEAQLLLEWDAVNSDDWYNSVVWAPRNGHGRKMSEDHKRKISESRKGMQFSEEHRRNMSISRVKRVGERRSEESKQRMSVSAKQRGVPRGTCPHCGIESTLPLLKRWHFDNCKFK